MGSSLSKPVRGWKYVTIIKKQGQLFQVMGPYHRKKGLTVCKMPTNGIGYDDHGALSAGKGEVPLTNSDARYLDEVIIGTGKKHFYPLSKCKKNIDY
jgi:hypothetical protein